MGSGTTVSATEERGALGMSYRRSTVLVTAAGGNQGRALIPRLAADGHRVRALRLRGSADELRALGAEEAIVGDLLDPHVRRRAFEGVEIVYHVGPTAHPREAELGLAAIEAAKESGVKHFVYASALHGGVAALVQHREKGVVEERLVGAGIPFTILQPAGFMETLNIGTALKTGLFKLIWDLERSQTLISVADVAKVAASVIATPRRHNGATYELCAPGAYTAFDIANMIAVVTCRSVVADRLEVAEIEHLYDYPEWGEEGREYRDQFFTSLLHWHGEHDFVGNSLVLRMLLGDEPISLADYVLAKSKAPISISSPAN
jgi:uncharacterized protein YbjT (DUF2867 family)